MHNIQDHELDVRIRTFLDRKFHEFPELKEEPTRTSTTPKIEHPSKQWRIATILLPIRTVTHRA